MGYNNVNGHRRMALDSVRNHYYFDALQELVTPESVVLDVGAGVGIHGLMAAALGAKHVYMVEPTSTVQIAERAALQNQLSSRITCIQGRIEDVALPEPVNLIVSVLTGNFLLSEDLLPSLFYARDQFLHPDGRLLPDAGRMVVMPVNAPDLYKQRIDAWTEPQFGVNLSPARKYAVNHVHFIRQRSADWPSSYEELVPPSVLASLDFMSDRDASCRSTIEAKVVKSGICHGLFGWFEMHLTDKWISTGPSQQPMHWSIAYLPIDPPLTLQRGETISMSVRRPENGDWTWSVKTENDARTHSTFLGNALTLDNFKKSQDAYVPALNTKGDVARFALARVNSSNDLAAIIDATISEFSDTSISASEIRKLVVNLVAKYG